MISDDERRDDGPELYLLEPDALGQGAPVPPVGTAWMNVLARFIEGDDATPRGRVWFQAREGR